MIGGLAALAMLATGQTAMNLNPAPCALTTSEQSWLDGAFRAWDFVRRKRFHLPEAPRPVIIMFDSHCRYEARPGGPLRWTGETFRDRVRLPNGDLIPPNVTAFAAPAGPGAPVFFVMALPPVWSAAHIQSGLGIDGLTQAVFLHEYSHTRQTYFATPYLAALTRRYHLPDDISDDSLQARFEHDANYVRAYERERDLLYATAASPDRAAARALANQALAMMRSRQARFVGAEAYWKPLDDIFLTMEGVGQWAAYSWLTDPCGRGLDSAFALREVRRDDRHWTQAEGLALILAVDRLLPDWPRLAFAPRPVLGVDLLAAAVNGRGARSP